MKREFIFYIMMMGLLVLALSSCKRGESPSNGESANEYFVSVWNELSIHRQNPSEDKLVILQPNNNLIVKVVRRGNPPKSGTNGLTVSYELTNYETSKDNGSEGCVVSWNMADTKGLFIAEEVQRIPFYQNGACNYYQTAHISVKTNHGSLIASTKVTIPALDEINCSKCHGSYMVNTFRDILTKHDLKHGTTFSSASNQPVVCISCHAGYGLGSASGSQVNLTKAIHGSHANKKGTGCNDCHISKQTKNDQNLTGKTSKEDCVSCHGEMAEIIANMVSTHLTGTLQPPCEVCHTGLNWTNSGQVFYGKPNGRGNPFCVACHSCLQSVNAASQNTSASKEIRY